MIQKYFFLCVLSNKISYSLYQKPVSLAVADLLIDHLELMRSAHLEDKQLYFLQCAMEENCLASQAYKLRAENSNWHLDVRRLLRFTATILNEGSDDFRPFVPKHLWQYHQCHM